MKINDAYKILKGRLAQSDQKSLNKIYQELLGALNNLKERDLSADERQSIETSLDSLRLQDADGISIGELRGRKNRFLKDTRKALSLISEDHYMALGLAFGVAFGGLISSVLQGFAGIPEGTSGTGVGVGLGLVAGYLIGNYLDIEARKQNRVLTTRSS
jgi:hypothetical protein